MPRSGDIPQMSQHTPSCTRVEKSSIFCKKGCLATPHRSLKFKFMVQISKKPGSHFEILRTKPIKTRGKLFAAQAPRPEGERSKLVVVYPCAGQLAHGDGSQPRGRRWAQFGVRRRLSERPRAHAAARRGVPGHINDAAAGVELRDPKPQVPRRRGAHNPLVGGGRARAAGRCGGHARR